MISQLAKDRRDEKVVAWINKQDERDLFLSVATLLEIRTGIEMCAAGKKRDTLEHWLAQVLPARFEERIVPIERHTADLAGRIIGRSTTEGWEIEPMDALIGSSAMVHDMTLATLNRKHFARLKIDFVEF